MSEPPTQSSIWVSIVAFLVALGVVVFIKRALMPHQLHPDKEGLWNLEVAVLGMLMAAVLLHEVSETFSRLWTRHAPREPGYFGVALVLLVALAGSLLLYVGIARLLS